MLKLRGLQVKVVDASRKGADPKRLVRALINRVNGFIAETIRIGHIRVKMVEPFFLTVKCIEPVIIGAHPKRALAVFKQ